MTKTLRWSLARNHRGISIHRTKLAPPERKKMEKQHIKLNVTQSKESKKLITELKKLYKMGGAIKSSRILRLPKGPKEKKLIKSLHGSLLAHVNKNKTRPVGAEPELVTVSIARIGPHIYLVMFFVDGVFHNGDLVIA
jgi:hypothetical protein